MFAKADPLAYTEESIAACKNASRGAILPRLGEGSGSSDDEPSSSNGHAQADGGQAVNGHVIAGAKKAHGKVREGSTLIDVLSEAEVVACSRMAVWSMRPQQAGDCVGFLLLALWLIWPPDPVPLAACGQTTAAASGSGH